MSLTFSFPSSRAAAVVALSFCCNSSVTAPEFSTPVRRLASASGSGSHTSGGDRLGPPPLPLPKSPPSSPGTALVDLPSSVLRFERRLTTKQKPDPLLLVAGDSYRTPIHPIVLCHGLFGYGTIGVESVPFLRMHYWKGIAEGLRQLGCRVFVTTVPAVGSIATRAKHLHSWLEQNAFDKKVNLVAHSMGGLDARHLISHLPSNKFQVSSLTSVATPHRGSSFMDWIKQNYGLGSKIGPISEEDNTQSMPASRSSALGNPYPNSLSTSHQPQPRQSETKSTRQLLLRAVAASIDAPAFGCLTTEFCDLFNTQTPDSPNVHYMSYAAVPSTAKLGALQFSHDIIMRREGINDGLVSLQSAMWGDFLGTADCHHWELIPSKLDLSFRKDRFDSVGFYLTLATKLSERGF